MTTTPYTAETIIKFLMGEGELAGVSFGEKPEGERGNFWWRKLLRAALSQQAALGVAGEFAESVILLLNSIEDDLDYLQIESKQLAHSRILWSKVAKEAYDIRNASQPHPTGGTQDTELPGMWERADFEGGRDEVRGPDQSVYEAIAANYFGDTQQEAVAQVTNIPGVLDLESLIEESQWPKGMTKLFTYPPAANALAIEVRDKAVEIVRNRVIWHEEQFEGERDAIINDIAAIPIPSPTSIGLAYEAAALQKMMDGADEARIYTGDVYRLRCESNSSEMGGNMDWARLEGAVFVCEKLRKLITPEGETALEALCMEVAITVVKHGAMWHDGINSLGVDNTALQGIVRATLNQHTS